MQRSLNKSCLRGRHFRVPEYRKHARKRPQKRRRNEAKSSPLQTQTHENKGKDPETLLQTANKGVCGQGASREGLKVVFKEESLERTLNPKGRSEVWVGAALRRGWEKKAAAGGPRPKSKKPWLVPPAAASARTATSYIKRCLGNGGAGLPQDTIPTEDHQHNTLNPKP